MNKGNGNGSAQAKERAQQLKATLGLDLYARYPLDVIEHRMDRPPQSAAERKNWRPIEDGEERLYHCYIRYSWCFPICYPYAVLTRDGVIVYDETDEPVPLTEEAAAQILGVPQQRVSEWRIRLVKKKLLRIDGLRTYALPKPPNLSPEERYTCTRVIADRNGPILPASFLRRINNLALDGDTRKALFGDAFKICEQFNEELSKLRAEKTKGLKDLCTHAEKLCTRFSEASTPDQEAHVHEVPTTVHEPAGPVHAAPLNKERARAQIKTETEIDINNSSAAFSSSPFTGMHAGRPPDNPAKHGPPTPTGDAPRLIDLRGLFPGEVITQKNLHALDRYLVQRLGSYDPKKFIEMVESRVAKRGRITAGLLFFDFDQGLANDFCELWQSKPDESQPPERERTPEEVRQAVETEEEWDSRRIEHLKEAIASTGEWLQANPRPSHGERLIRWVGMSKTLERLRAELADLTNGSD